MPDVVSGASVSFNIAASAQSGIGVYGKVADALKGLNLTDLPALDIKDDIDQRFVLM